ncbi:bifunctional enoyl-CoA hydratase/phosphate acetyltransferase [Peptostreptococcus canis]|uniref:Bifunctional enoyl-CoA hydratase/phosphate acetyltransferase n=1 Tax=Peptostreptococcus canis TaxID=1159213 RepID=A0ABR6TLU3_9FIRM|nr:bifunctional enoyl-CoA hydratase/phosphate acetyltransferase [Peptostreptococcus canis]MBC2576129.1 bifunctional enoyl-CoA hydratase/phosphate acetyltransferase [Peptostreptococcus canis]MBP1998338.1 phosphate butyryltransferase [Peptostreptococcus canis]
MIKTFDEVIEKVKAFPKMKVVGVCMADDAAIGGALSAEKIGLATPVFIGHEDEIRKILNEMGEKKEYEIINVDTAQEGAEKVVELVREGKVDFILKGHIETAVLMRAVVDKEKGLRTGRHMSHMSFEELPTYHKILTITDGGMSTYPDVDDKQKIIENAVEIYHRLGYDCPKVACLSAIEKVNPKMPCTVDAAELKARNQRGEIKGCIVEGPISFDLAYSKNAAKVKEYESEVAGDPDILLAPDIQAGNILDKTFNFAAGGRMAGFIVGAKCLIVLTSRSASAEEKYLSIAMAALANQ